MLFKCQAIARNKTDIFLTLKSLSSSGKNGKINKLFSYGVLREVQGYESQREEMDEVSKSYPFFLPHTVMTPSCSPWKNNLWFTLFKYILVSSLFSYAKPIYLQIIIPLAVPQFSVNKNVFIQSSIPKMCFKEDRFHELSLEKENLRSSKFGNHYITTFHLEISERSLAYYLL